MMHVRLRLRRRSASRQHFSCFGAAHGFSPRWPNVAAVPTAQYFCGYTKAAFCKACQICASPLRLDWSGCKSVYSTAKRSCGRVVRVIGKQSKTKPDELQKMNGPRMFADSRDAEVVSRLLWIIFDQGNTRRRPVPLKRELEAPAKFAHRYCRYLASCVSPLWHRTYD